MRRRLLATALLLTTAVGVACGRSGADFLDDGTTTVPTVTPSPTASGSPTAVPTSGLVISEVFVRDKDTAASDANRSPVAVFESGGDDRFIEVVNLSGAPFELNGVRIVVDGNADGVFGNFHLFGATVLAPGKAAVVFNDRSGVNLTAVRNDAGPDTLVVESNSGNNLGNDMTTDDTALAVRLYAQNGALLYHWDAELESVAGTEKVVLRAGTTTSGLVAMNLGVEPDACNATNCSEIYSIAVEDPVSADAPVWTDHRAVGVPSGTACSTAVPESCCRFSPGRWVDSGTCRRF